MSIFRDKKYAQVRAGLETNIRAMMARLAISYQGDLKIELSKPGTGRFYARHKRTKAMSSNPGTFELSAGQVASILKKEQRDFAARLGKNPKARPKNLRGLGVHRASAPGHPPAVDTGTLRRSMQVDLSKANQSTSITRVGTNVKYAKALEYGSPMRKLKPRPYFRTTAKAFRRKIPALIVASERLLFRGLPR